MITPGRVNAALALFAITAAFAFALFRVRGSDEIAEPRSSFGRLTDCTEGGVELSDTDCDEVNHCTKQTTRLTWSREGGALFEGDGNSERELHKLNSSQVGVLLSEVSAAIDRHESDGPDVVCLGDCPPTGRKLGITADCSGSRTWLVLMRASLRERMRSPRPDCFTGMHSEVSPLRCRAEAAVRDFIGSHQSDRVIKMMKRMRE